MNIIQKTKVVKKINKEINDIKKNIRKKEDSIVELIKNKNLNIFLKDILNISINGGVLFYLMHLFFELSIFSNSLLTLCFLFIVLGISFSFVYFLIKVRKKYNNEKLKDKTELFKVIFNILKNKTGFTTYQEYIEKDINKMIKNLSKEEKRILLKCKKFKFIHNDLYMDINEQFYKELRNPYKKSKLKLLPKSVIENFIEEEIKDKEKAYLLLEKEDNKKEIINFKNKKIISL
tara:strand:- start:1270 stop:1968 length:699 start_codon:yes stop_codon:yes gene_type:complete